MVFVLLLLAVFELSGFRAHCSLAFLQQTVRAHQTSRLLIVIANFALRSPVQIRGWSFLAAAVLALGPLWGVVTYLAAAVSCIVTFFTSRLLRGDALRQVDSKVAARLLSHLDAHPVTSILLLRVLFQTVPVLNYTLAVSGVRFSAYLTGTLLGLPIPIAAYCVFFDYLAKVFKIA